MANRVPYNLKFCKGVVQDECPNLKGNEMCKLEECIYNHKRVLYWLKRGRLPGEEDG